MKLTHYLKKEKTMNVEKKKLNELKKHLKGQKKFSKPISILNYSSLVKKEENNGKIIEIWTNALRKALEENEHVYFPKGEYFIDDTVVLTSNRKISAHKKAFISIVENLPVNMFHSDCVVDGSYAVISDDMPRTKNIQIVGGTWGTQSNCRAKYGKEGAFDREDSLHGVHALWHLSSVENLFIKDVTFKNTASFAVQLGRVNNFVVENIVCDGCFADGVHINGQVNNGVVFNVSGTTEDDLVALNAYDWANSTINNGPIQNLIIHNVNSTGGHCHCMRILPGITADDKGGIDCFIKNVRISKIKGVQTFKMYLQTPFYIDYPDGTNVGHIEDITFEDIELVKDRVSDNTFNYHNKDLVTGHFGVFEIGSNVNKLTLKNIKAKLPLEDFPDTAHFLTVGPKCCYVPEKNQEIFDPYVSCVCKEIVYGNIVIDGNKVEDLTSYIKEISFEDLYESKMPFGNGKVEMLTKLK